jgi:SPP1 gp7 family putative phage head morphogenesis protein
MTKLEREIADALNPIVDAFYAQLESTLTAHVVTGYIAGAKQMDRFSRSLRLIVPEGVEGPPMQQAVTWAQKHCATAVTQIGDTTKRELAQLISDGIKERRGIPGLKRDINNKFASWVKDSKDKLGRPIKNRAEMIARTETASALSKGSLQRAKDIGVTGKRWVTVGDDRVSDICLKNEAVGDIPINQAFPSGHSGPPSHPRCRCVSAPSMLGQ